MNKWNSFWGHVRDLRNTVLTSLAIIVVGTLCALYYYPLVFSVITRPLYDSVRTERFEIKHERIHNTADHAIDIPIENSQIIYTSSSKIPSKGFIDIEYLQKKNPLVILGPLEGIVISLKVSFWLGLVVTSPLWIFLILRFISPALHGHEKRLVIPFLALSFLFLTCGFLFAYLLTIPCANSYLLHFNTEIANNFWSLSYYVEYTITLLFATAFAFELCAILLLLVHYGLISSEFMSAKRRYVIVLAFIIGAVLTPPDIFTQFLLAIPLLGLYELILLYAKIRQRIFNRKTRRGSRHPQATVPDQSSF